MTERISSGGTFLGKRYKTDIWLASEAAKTLMPNAPWWHFCTIEGEPHSKSVRGPVYDAAVHSTKAMLAQTFKERAEGNLSVVCVFFRSNGQRIDTDNLLKFVLDCATGICWNDDSQVTGISGFLEADANRPRTIVLLGPHASTITRSGHGTVKHTCIQCGTAFYRYLKTSKFCSHACMGAAYQTLSGEVPCAHCQKPFRRKVTKQIFCSGECRTARMIARNKSHATPRPTCRSCGKLLTKHGYVLCRECWRGKWKK